MDVDGLNAGYARDLLEDYLENPEAVPSEWRHLFESGDSELVATQPGLVRLLEVLDNGHDGAEPAQAASVAEPAPEPAPAPETPVPAQAAPQPEAVPDELLGAVAAAMALG